MDNQIAASALSVLSLSDQAVRAISSCAHPQQARSNETIVAHMDTTRLFFILTSGTVRVSMIAPNGRALTYQMLKAGDMFGEVGALDGGPRTASVIAETDCVLLRIEPADFQHLLRTQADFMQLIMDKLVRTNRWLTERLIEYHAYDVRGRVYATLLRLDAEQAEDFIQITDRDLASRIGTTRENVTRIHRDLKQQGLIDRRQSKLKVLDRRRMESLLKDCEFS